METPDPRHEIRNPEAEELLRRYGSVRLPAVRAALPFCGPTRPCPKSEERRRAFLLSPRFGPLASD